MDEDPTLTTIRRALSTASLVIILEEPRFPLVGELLPGTCLSIHALVIRGLPLRPGGPLALIQARVRASRCRHQLSGTRKGGLPVKDLAN